MRQTLENAIRQSRIAHGYILAGQRGTGKTTVARIIARCLNCVQGPTPEPCGVCASCQEVTAGASVDVIEIDAASNRGINEMRELRENVRYRPARDRYKVFIIDEAHQITSEAFNALLKTLEEPPEWVVFVLCTTEVHKIPTTIASRCQQFSFRSVDFGQLIERMRWICEQEGINADDEVLTVIAQAGEGSVRDSLSALDQAIACCGETLNAKDLRSLLGLFSTESLRTVAEALQASDPARMLEIVQELEQNGRSLQHFCRELARYFRNLLVAKIAGTTTPLIAASAMEQQKLIETASHFAEEDLTRYLQLTLDTFKELQTSLQPRLHMEMGLVRLVHAGRMVAVEEALGQLAGPSTAPKTATAAATPAPKAHAGPSPFQRDAVRKVAPPASAPRAVEAPTPIEGDAALREALHAALVDLGMPFTADAIEHSEVRQAGADVECIVPKEFSLAVSESDLKKGFEKALGRVPRLRITVGTPQVQAVPLAKPAGPPPGDQDATERALADPGVKRFQELFPDAQVRTVRNLKE